MIVLKIHPPPQKFLLQYINLRGLDYGKSLLFLFLAFCRKRKSIKNHNFTFRLNPKFLLKIDPNLMIKNFVKPDTFESEIEIFKPEPEVEIKIIFHILIQIRGEIITCNHVFNNNLSFLYKNERIHT